MYVGVQGDAPWDLEDYLDTAATMLQAGRSNAPDMVENFADLYFIVGEKNGTSDSCHLPSRAFSPDPQTVFFLIL